MKPPKEPKTFKRPRLYYQETSFASDRMRILYPDGTSEWWLCSLNIFSCVRPCWADNFLSFSLKFDDLGRNKSAWAALEAMRAYDEKQHFPPADFLGEL